ncbi:MAG: hypothetical protein H6732_10255 [Alphaproteobacteria bacterium]|nr:hypothetical protein [Alphaproteobacteria bacterium]
MLLDPRNGPDFDLPPDTGPRQAYVLASVPRSGSTLLARALWEAGGVGAPKEYLNPMQIRDWEVRLGASAARRGLHRLLRGPLLPLAGRGRWPRERLAGHLERVRARRSSGGWFGLKLHHHHFRHWFGDRGWDPEAMLGPITWVRVLREDREAQAVSWARALQTGQWASWQDPRRTARYDARLVRRCLVAIARQEAGWEAWLDARGAAVHVVRYEALVADWEGTVGALLAHLGREGAGVPAPSLARQADEVSEAWLRRLRG